jgi:hypothetical protein
MNNAKRPSSSFLENSNFNHNSSQVKRIKNEQEEETESNLPSSGTLAIQSTFLVYIGNIDNRLEDYELEELLNSFNSPNRALISSVHVYKDSITIEIANENEANNLARHFNNFVYRSIKLKSFVIKHKLVEESQSENEQSERENFSVNHSSKRNSLNSTGQVLLDCLICVTSRQLKYKAIYYLLDKLHKIDFYILKFKENMQTR